MPPLEDRLARLSELRREQDPDAARPELRKSLADKSPYLVEKAAKLTAELGLDELSDDLAAGFDRFMVDPVASDKGCVAKTAVARALVDLEAQEDDVFLRGVRHRQMEPAYGGSVDTAVMLRAASAEGLLVCGHPNLGLEMTDLLVDSETPARLAAARVLAASGRPEAEPLLRLKARLGDAEPEVTSEALTGLLAMAPQRSLTFVSAFLEDDDRSIVEAAALALGESRLEEAVPMLVKRYESCYDERLQRTLLVSISMMRREPGLEYLLSMVSEGTPDRARRALVALAIHRGDETLRERVKAEVSRRGHRGLREAFRRELGSS